MGMCLNKKVIAGLAVGALGVFLFAPSVFGAALPLLILAACPLSMVLMMRAMSGNGGGSGSKADPDGQADTTDELAALRAEVQHLRTAQARHDAAAGPDNL